MLTWCRVFFVPLIVVAMWMDTAFSRYVAVILFALGGLSDFLDGLLARKWQQCSPFGRFLDPVADKALVCSTLVMFVANGDIRGVHIFPCVAMILREILISAAREFAALNNAAIPSSKSAKLKTATQITSLSCMLVARVCDFHGVLHTTGLVFLWASAALALSSASAYIRRKSWM